MRGTRTISAISAIIALSILPGKATAATSYWDHNGSSMRLEEQGKKRRFVYEHPRDSIAAAGVKPGTVFFDGEQKADGRLAGYAKLFRKGCDPVDYFVEGALDKSKGEILLQGQAPIYSGEGCKITGYSDDGGASSLTFAYRGGGEPNIAHNDGAAPAHKPDQGPNLADHADDSRSYDDRRAYDDRTNDEARYGDQRRYDDPRSYDDRRGYDERRGNDDPGYEPRDYAERRDRVYRSRRYDGYYPPANPDDPENDYTYDDRYDNEPAYAPYQPRWRRY